MNQETVPDGIKTGQQVLAEYNDQPLEDMFAFVTLEEMISVAVAEAFNKGKAAVSCETIPSGKSPLPKSNFFLSESFAEQARKDLDIGEGKKGTATVLIDYIMKNHEKKFFHSWDIENALKTAFDVWVTESTITRIFRNLDCVAVKPEKGKRSYIYLHPARA